VGTFDDSGNATAKEKPPFAIVTCMDYRLDIGFILTTLKWRAAYIIRNAGGVATDDAVRSLLMIQQLVSGPVAIAVVTHEGGSAPCGMTTFTDTEMQKKLEADLKMTPPFCLESFNTAELGVHRSIQRLRASPFISSQSREALKGYVYVLNASDQPGALREVKVNR
jgi:carbonic anhydrase